MATQSASYVPNYIRRHIPRDNLHPTNIPTSLSILLLFSSSFRNIYFIVIFSIKMSSLDRPSSPPNSNLKLTKPVALLLFRKYDNPFNFYLTRPINHIVHNRKSEPATLTAKDVAVLVEDIEYLKRYYCGRTLQGKNQIKDRMTLLLGFYATANMLQYQYPCMVINQLQELFAKRRKKLSHPQGEESSGQESQSHGSEKQMPLGKQSEKEGEQVEMLDDLDWSDIVNCHEPPEREKTAKASLDFEDDFSIYEGEPKKKDAFFSKIQSLTSQLAYEMTFDELQNERDVSHLILDFDDLDRERIVRQYTKLTNKQNHPLPRSNSPKVTKMHSLAQRKPLSSSITIDSSKEFAFKQRRNETAFNRQSMFIGSREERDQQIKVMKKSSDFQHQAKKAFVFSQDMVISENDCEQSPMHEELTSFPKMSHFAPIEPQQTPKKQHTIMKHSEILHNGNFIREKYQFQSNNAMGFRTELTKLKENPFELKEIMKIENHNEPQPPKGRGETVHPKQSKNELPFYLKRVKSQEQLKPFVHEDKGFYKFTKKQ